MPLGSMPTGEQILDLLEALSAESWAQQFNNLLIDGSFESWRAGVAAIPDGFTNLEFVANVTYSQSIDEYDGAYAVIVTTDATGDGGPQQVVPVRSGRTYTMSVMAKISAAAPTFSFGYRHTGATYVEGPVETATGAYVRYTWTFIAAADADFVYLVSHTAATSILFDSWILVEGTIAPIFAPAYVEAATNVKARAYLSADQLNIATGVHTKVLLDTMAYDPGSHFDTVNNRFTFPVDGYYQVSASVRYLDATVVADKRWGCLLRLNGGPWLTDFYSHSSSNATICISVSDILHFNATDFLELWTLHLAGVDTPDIAGGEPTLTFLAIHLLSKG